MKGVAAGEALLLLAILCLAYLAYLQQAQLAELEIEVDRLRGATGSIAKTMIELGEKGA